MRIDLSKAAAAALDAALADAQPRKRLTAPRAIVAGATVAIAARYAVTKAPSLPRVPALSAVPDLVRDHMPDGLRDHMPDGLRDRLAERGWLDDEAESDDEDLEANAPDDLDEGDEEPEAEAAREPQSGCDPTSGLRPLVALVQCDHGLGDGVEHVVVDRRRVRVVVRHWRTASLSSRKGSRARQRRTENRTRVLV